MERINFESWLSGIYMMYSIGATFGENNPYPQKPIELFQAEEASQAKLSQDSELFGAYAAMFNKQFKEKIQINAIPQPHRPQATDNL